MNFYQRYSLGVDGTSTRSHRPKSKICGARLRLRPRQRSFHFARNAKKEKEKKRKKQNVKVIDYSRSRRNRRGHGLIAMAFRKFLRFYFCFLRNIIRFFSLPPNSRLSRLNLKRTYCFPMLGVHTRSKQTHRTEINSK